MYNPNKVKKPNDVINDSVASEGGGNENYSKKLLELSKTLNNNRYLLDQSTDSTVEILEDFNLLLSKLVLIDNETEARIELNNWIRRMFGNITEENKMIFDTLNTQFLDLFNITFEKYENKRKEVKKIREKELENLPAVFEVPNYYVKNGEKLEYKPVGYYPERGYFCFVGPYANGDVAGDLMKALKEYGYNGVGSFIVYSSSYQN